MNEDLDDELEARLLRIEKALAALGFLALTVTDVVDKALGVVGGAVGGALSLVGHAIGPRVEHVRHEIHAIVEAMKVDDDGDDVRVPSGDAIGDTGSPVE